MFNTIIVYVVYITTKVTDYRYDLGVKGQFQIYLKLSFMACNANTSFIFDIKFLAKDVHIQQNYCLRCVDYNEGYRLPL